jgi:hypothetical protein
MNHLSVEVLSEEVLLLDLDPRGSDSHLEEEDGEVFRVDFQECWWLELGAEREDDNGGGSSHVQDDNDDDDDDDNDDNKVEIGFLKTFLI